MSSHGSRRDWNIHLRSGYAVLNALEHRAVARTQALLERELSCVEGVEVIKSESNRMRVRLPNDRKTLAQVTKFMAA